MDDRSSMLPVSSEARGSVEAAICALNPTTHVRYISGALTGNLHLRHRPLCIPQSFTNGRVW